MLKTLKYIMNIYNVNYNLYRLCLVGNKIIMKLEKWKNKNYLHVNKKER